MDFKQFEERMGQFNRELPDIMQRIYYQLGEELLNHVIDELDSQDLIDTGTLWNSFTQGDQNNVWQFDGDRNTLSLEVGSNLTYAEYLNEGYTIDKSYFVPGYWNGVGKFIYDPSAKGGFMVKPRSFIGRKYFDIALRDFQGGMKALLERMLQTELERMLR
ncbi:HK97 gp10 family phage protein [Brevibacillus porteri]|uniref:Terminase n=1 Tax=Brevibacillus porteri TaxID=2126350 RepID=A0ABX5FG19_9BACL|nr:HK97 gp10 family phage protein [Brevibacillus porteri]MED1802250.1 HK97 gp10 family phage protein [Brevibacillus porteri]MED2130003.1 HK97 gp10 family phage protein [Brevibacillus porteri]MED2745747.1 HK97 gp10 family phage protein [Brevibacillus porteri]MED2816631.1 HK97 gp10 family phage protein [Brevibacillus porteri]MED2897366.1 HK97 gp10 family phage protein [Brevibacillus porteri]